MFSSNINKIVFINFCQRFHLYIHAYALLLLMRGLSLVQISLIESVVIGTIFLMEAPTGVLADRLGRKWSIAGGFAVQLAGLLFIALGADTLLLTIGGVIWIFGSAVSQPSLYAVAIDTAPANRRGVAMSSYTMSFQIGSGISSIIGGLIAEHFGYSWLNWFCVATAVFGLLVVLVLARGWDKPH